MKRLILPIMVTSAVALLAPACGGKSDPTPPATPTAAAANGEKPAAEPSATPAEPKTAPAATALVEQARKLAALRDAIKANPGDVDTLLAKAGLTEEQLEAALFEIAADPEASAVYAGQP